MKLVSVDTIPERKKGYTKWSAILDEFMNSDATIVRLEGWTNKDAYSCQSSIHKAINTYRLDGVQAMARNGEVYLVKTV